MYWALTSDLNTLNSGVFKSQVKLQCFPKLFQDQIVKGFKQALLLPTLWANPRTPLFILLQVNFEVLRRHSTLWVNPMKIVFHGQMCALNSFRLELGPFCHGNGKANLDTPEHKSAQISSTSNICVQQLQQVQVETSHHHGTGSDTSTKFTHSHSTGTFGKCPWFKYWWGKTFQG